MWVLVAELSLSGLVPKCPFLLSHLSGPKIQLLISFYYYEIYLFYFVCEYFVCLYVSIARAWLVPVEAEEGILWL